MKVLTLFRPANQYGSQSRIVADKFVVDSVRGFIRVEVIGGQEDGLVLYPGAFPFSIGSAKSSDLDTNQ